MTAHLPTDYQEYIAQSRYARFIDSKGRRENWSETVDRYFDYYLEELLEHHGYVPSATLVSELKDAVLNLHVMPSMRALMTAGPAAKNDNMATFNCSFSAIDRVKALADILYILMNGTGVGFSVERQFINKLPCTVSLARNNDDEFVIRDSKRGWAEAFLYLLQRLYAGTIPKFNYSEIRPKGSRLKTFGGRASGPEPLRELLEFTTRVFGNAAGRKLHSVDIHEILCKTGEIVVVGGVRRAALISLSNLSDLRMRDIKSGNWWQEKSHLELSNNSVAYTEKPDVGAFMDEWSALYKSKSGERGIFNREGAIRKIMRLGRRDYNDELGCNPCGEAILRNRGLCNLSEAVARENDGLVELKEKVRLASILGTWQSTQTRFKFVDPEWKKNAEEERLLGVSLTGIFDNELLRGDKGHGALSMSLSALKGEVIATNLREAKAIGINPSVATTVVKPSGTVSQLVNSPSGIHPGHSAFYIRRVSADNKDPVTAFMADSGVPNEPHASKPQNMTVFSFPVKLSAKTKRRDDLTAIEHLELMKTYNVFWAEHAVSCTISVRENEWPSVGGWVYDNFDDLSGVTFLPYFEGDSSYAQMPYETIDEATYEKLVSKMPSKIDWSGLRFYENGEDTVTSTQEFACAGNACEIVGK